MPSELDVLAAAVTGALTGGITKPLLAPADALADHWKAKVRNRLDKTGRAVERKRGSSIQSTNDRLTYRVFLEAAFTEDEVVREYLAGVVAGSSNESDEGAPVLAQLTKLSSLQVRLHYVIYREVWRALQRGLIRPQGGEWSWVHTVYLPGAPLATALMSPSFENAQDRLVPAVSWLSRDDLLSGGSESAPRIVGPDHPLVVPSSPAQSKARRYTVPEPGIAVTCTAYGVELFLWGCGAQDRRPSALSKLAPQQVSFEPEVPEIDGRLLEELQCID